MVNQSTTEIIGDVLPLVAEGREEDEIIEINAYRAKYASQRLGYAGILKDEISSPTISPCSSRDCEFSAHDFTALLSPEDNYASASTSDEDEEQDRFDVLPFVGADYDQTQNEIAELRSQLAAATNRITELETKLIDAGLTAPNSPVQETPEAELTDAQLAARDFCRAETANRAQKRSSRVIEAQSEVASKVGRGGIEGSTYHFTTGRPVRTDVIVARGVVSNPMAAAFEIIPMSSASSPLFVFTDETVNGLYGDKFVQGFRDMGYLVHKIVLPDGEDAKTLDQYAKYADQVLSTGIDKSSVLISLGGGAVANVCGFIASTLHRGIGLIHFPTTLLAQCDASISHKQAVNAPHGKNLVGSYYAPIRIVVDPDVLQTLEDWLLPDGMGEILKHALCQDVNLLKYLEDYKGDIADPDFLEYVVRRTIELKCEVIDVDPKEHKEAVVLIYGHTLAHPIESISHRMGTACCLSHGQAVAIGCVIAARVAVEMGMCDEAMIARTEALCQKFNLPYLVPADQSVDRIMAKLPFNKTWTKEGTMMALIERPGKIFTFDDHFKSPVSDDVIRRAVEDTMAPFGTIIKGSGSSGLLRKNKLSNIELQRPGAGWANAAGAACADGDCDDVP